jgi:hypothetical protein
MSAGFFDDQTLDLPCGACGHETPKTVGWIKANDHFVCDACGTRTNLDRSDLLGKLKKAEKALDDFGRNLKF